MPKVGDGRGTAKVPEVDPGQSVQGTAHKDGGEDQPAKLLGPNAPGKKGGK